MNAARQRPPGSAFGDPTLAERAWDRTRKAVRRWSLAGAACGLLAGLLAFAPAAWLADEIGRRSDGRLLLADARGTVWSGSAVPVLAGGADSRSAAVLPGRLSWSIGLRAGALEMRLAQPCCIDDTLLMLLRPGFGGLSVELPPGGGAVGEWPAAWLAGLGAPWNSLQLSGALQLASPGLTLQLGAGRWRLNGQAELRLRDVASPLTPVGRLGSYSLHIEGRDGQPATLRLSTLDGALRLQGDGQWSGTHFRFRGEAQAAPGFEPALDNLLNLIGRRQGALSVLAIG